MDNKHNFPFYTKGFSIIEFLIGMAMTVIIFMVATNLVISFLNVNTKSKRSQELEQAKIDITHDITNDITWGTNIQYTKGINKLTIDSTTYELSGTTLLKNSVAMTPTTVKVTGFSVTEYKNDPANPKNVSYKVEIPLVHADSENIKDEVTVFASPRADQ